MTLAQLRYVITVAQLGTLSSAAKRLYISQPSLTSAIKELEKELGITIFIRTNKGVILSRQGEEFLGYARQVIEQTNLIEEKYLQDHNVKHEFCISTQHYSFAVEAFVSLIKEYGGKEYDFRIRETQTYEIIEDVAKLKSEIGVLYLNSFNEVVLKKTLKENDLTFHRLFIAKPHVFIGKDIKTKIDELSRSATIYGPKDVKVRLVFKNDTNQALGIDYISLFLSDGKETIPVHNVKNAKFNSGLAAYMTLSDVASASLLQRGVVSVTRFPDRELKDVQVPAKK